MKSINNLLTYLLLFGVAFSCTAQSNVPQKVQEEPTGELLYAVDFEKASDLELFKAETEINEEEVSLKEGALDIDAIKGTTVWFNEKLTAPVRIEYTAVVVDEGGANDRVSDLNCFFMAIDPRCPANIFSCADSVRTGSFGTYHDLRTYYVGYGGNDNQTTRMRRYPGYTRERPMLPEHDLGEPYTIVPNVPIKISIEVIGEKITYSHDGKVVFTLNDKLPYNEGWFAFRTVRNHLKIIDFKVIKLNQL